MEAAGSWYYIEGDEWTVLPGRLSCRDISRRDGAGAGRDAAFFMSVREKWGGVWGETADVELAGTGSEEGAQEGVSWTLGRYLPSS